MVLVLKQSLALLVPAIYTSDASRTPSSGHRGGNAHPSRSSSDMDVHSSIVRRSSHARGKPCQSGPSAKGKRVHDAKCGRSLQRAPSYSHRQCDRHVAVTESHLCPPARRMCSGLPVPPRNYRLSPPRMTLPRPAVEHWGLRFRRRGTPGRFAYAPVPAPQRVIRGPAPRGSLRASAYMRREVLLGSFVSLAHAVF
ncbi:uncharacterized protein PHACADRAFT_256536 [Phanerochaete carnosa HHB-10118-sp]|uniref:Secreted protein n=1 Tax=Phanerochaete carnosa (strain HHB-10118-sp) TaxID=650164 RepID=K5W9R4_PHACS|nr:uncharacterized protein PHACADRAFT_256536 [Phanerochaete carnosa HHB-10118-sp]EKM55714.1 hypothetical protein PHACADRAFT_256536 [Phanerochaete carnosa HHB-10118-sp]